MPNFTTILQTDTLLTPVDWEAVQLYFYLALAALDILYVFHSFVQSRTSEIRYPSSKWTSTAVRRAFIIPHALFGCVSIYSGTLFVICLQWFPDTITDVFTQRISYTLALSMILHAFTCIGMNTIPHGNRQFTVPAYISQTIINTIQATLLLITPSNGNQLLSAWASMNVFILVRLLIAAQYFGSVDFLQSGYLYAQVVAGMLVVVFARQSPLFFVGVLAPAAFGKYAGRLAVSALKMENASSSDNDVECGQGIAQETLDVKETQAWMSA
ncbi:hypothetical protein HDU80_008401 [Chytriomyces hyalinus]|nr:hypothetical protein HDU80_008401 [Chytriomyces hyalinus]